MITTAQIRGARGILGWSQGDLAERTDISATSIGSIENGITQARTSTLEIIQRTFEGAGIEFLASDGIRKKSLEVDILRGTEGFQRFSQMVYEAAQRSEDDILQAFVDDIKFAEILEKDALPHVRRIESLKSKKFKIIQKEGDLYFPAKTYADYRWIPSEFFMAVPFTVFGDSFAVILYEPDPVIVVMNYPALSSAYRKQFSILWEKSKIVPQNLVDQWELPERYKTES